MEKEEMRQTRILRLRIKNLTDIFDIVQLHGTISLICKGEDKYILTSKLGRFDLSEEGDVYIDEPAIILSREEETNGIRFWQTNGVRVSSPLSTRLMDVLANKPTYSWEAQPTEVDFKEIKVLMEFNKESDIIKYLGLPDFKMQGLKHAILFEGKIKLDNREDIYITKPFEIEYTKERGYSVEAFVNVESLYKLKKFTSQTDMNIWWFPSNTVSE